MVAAKTKKKKGICKRSSNSTFTSPHKHQIFTQDIHKEYNYYKLLQKSAPSAVKSANFTF